MKFRSRQIAVVLLLITVMVGLSGHVAHAGLGSGIADMFGLNIGDWVTEMAAWVVNLSLMMASYILAISGFLLNFSMNMTLGIKNFVDSTPAIYTVWKAIRDISGMFIIGMLLYAAIKMILGKDAKMGALIKTIVMAGILINFSFFFTGLGIDVSNIVSVQLYNAIAPANKLAQTNQGLSPEGVKSTFKDGGISDIFMNSLKVQNLYDTKNLKLNEVGKANNNSIVSAPLKIILGGVVGVIIMYTAAASFFFASIAFIVRFVILLFLLAFSPIWFAAYAIPQLGDYATKWTKLYKNQLLFMPVYLLLMYFAMSVLVSNTMFGSGFAGNLGPNDAWYSNFLILGVNAALVIIMLNAPLMAALALGAKMPGIAKKFGADAIWKSVGSWTGRNTAGRLVSRVNESNFMRNQYAKNPTIGKFVSSNLSKASSAGWGGGKDSGFDQVRKKKVDSYKKFAEGLGYDDRGMEGKKLAALEKHTKETEGLTTRATLIRQRRDSYLNTPTRTADEAAELKKLVDADTKELEKLEQDIQNRNKEETQKSVIKGVEDTIKNERKNKVIEKFNKKTNKFNKAVVGAIKKEKTPTDEIIAALKGELGGDKGKDKDAGGEKK